MKNDFDVNCDRVIFENKKHVMVKTTFSFNMIFFFCIIRTILFSAMREPSPVSRLPSIVLFYDLVPRILRASRKPPSCGLELLHRQHILATG
jgi:hypothetical protein